MVLQKTKAHFEKMVGESAKAYAMATKRSEAESTADDERCQPNQFPSLYAQYTKTISQVIAKSWLSNDAEGAEIKKTLLYGTEEEIKKMMLSYGVDWDKLFGPLTVKIRVDWDTFFGNFKEIAGLDEPLQINIPYPPKPAELTDQQLTDWINDESDAIYPTTAYIPLTCC